MKTLYQCEVCQTLYGTSEEAIPSVGYAYACETQEVPPPLFIVGEEIYIQQRYPQRNEQPFGKRTIVKHTIEKHLNCYYLDEFIEVGEALHLAEVGWKWLIEDGDEDSPLLDEDYGVHCFKLGDEVDLRYHFPHNKRRKLTLDLVDDN